MCETNEEREKWVNIINSVTGFQDLNQKYEIKENIDEGRFGIVKRCIQKNTGLEAAIKIISKSEMEPHELQQARTEIEILKICQHPNIVKLFDLYENHEFIYISKIIY